MASTSTRKLAAHDRTRSAILEAAAQVLAYQGMSAKLDTVAHVAGISRATLYRYFSSREELLQALLDAAYEDIVKQVRAARVNEVDFEEGLARVARAAALTGNNFAVFKNNEVPVPRPRQLDEEYERTLNELFERGKAEGFLRSDRPTPWLRAVFRSILIEANRFGPANGLGVEETAALSFEQFLAGSRPSRTG